MLSFRNNDPIVVSGMSGKVANADNVFQFQEQIYNKMDMITKNNNRFPRMPEVPERYGAIPRIDKFDNGFFAVPEREVEYMDPTNRMLLETVCEALIDAGLSLKEIKGSRTGIYIGNSQSEGETVCYNDTPPQTFALKGSTKTVSPIQISHYLEIDGPCYACDSSCSSSIYAMEHAIKDIESGRIDYALICGTNLILTPNVTRQLYRLGALSLDGKCKTFDHTANGYVRSDTNLCMVLQRRSAAKRNYADVVHCKVNCDGFKEEGITFPSSYTQLLLLSDFYDECKIPSEKIGFVEMHGTGTAAGDPVELESVENLFCKTRKEPLLIGSVKSNLGHGEGASGLSAILKVCMIYETGLIPPTIHCHTPNTRVEALKNGKLVVVTESTPLPDDKPYVAVCNYGFGGSNGHVLLRRPIMKRPKVIEEFPRLLCIGGRTSEAVKTIFEDVKTRPYDPDYIALLNASFSHNIPEYNDRGYSIVKKSGIGTIEVLNYTDLILPLKCFFHTSGIISVAPTLLKFIGFQEHLKQVGSVLKQNNIAWDTSSLTSCTYNPADNILTTVIVQTGIVKLLKVLNIEIAGFFGHGIGEISASYAVGVIDLDQTLLFAHRITKLLHENQELDISKQLKNVSNGVCKHKNLALDFAQVTPKSSIIDKENLLIIGGNAANSSHIVSLCDKDDGHGFLHSLGRLYLLGYAMTVNSLYSVTWPVHQGTPMISPLIKWRHNKSWTHMKYKKVRPLHKIFVVRSNNPNWQNIDGTITMPPSCFVYLVMSVFSGEPEKRIFIENMKFLRTCTLPEVDEFKVCVDICAKTGYFEITESDTLVGTGYIYDDNENEWIHLDPLPTPKPEDILSKQDVYKELGLRGYYYQGDFTEIQNCDVNGTVANIKWTNWIPFLDSLFLIKIIQEDTRSFSVPTKISKITIDPKKHLEIVLPSGNGDDCVMPAYHYKDVDIIRCGHIEIRGLVTSSVVMRREHPLPVLEANRFVPYIANLDLKVAARVVAQVAVENNSTLKIKALEIFKDVPTIMEPLLPYIRNALNDQLLIQSELILISDEKIELDNITVLDKSVSSEIGNFIAVGYNLSQNAKLRKTLTTTLNSGGFLISRENLKSAYGNFPGLTTVCEYTTSNEILIMLKVSDKVILSKPIHISENGFKWLSLLKEAHQNKENLLLYADNEPNGLMGLTKCLVTESDDKKVMNVLIDDKSAPRFDIGSNFYKKQLEKNLCINVYKNGTWGSYRHLLLEDNYRVNTVQNCVINTKLGDLTSLCWMQGNLSVPEVYNVETPGMSRVHVYVGSLNFRDVMVATGRIKLESITKNRKFHECCLGIEFSARKETGERVMGMYPGGALATVLQVNDKYLWNIPDDWTMEEGATVPVAYSTILYGLIMRANMVEAESILIHSATGEMSISAINVALHYNCHIFLTVETQEEKDFILQMFPQIPIHHIGKSRDTIFYERILKHTGGKGVDLIFNSLADEQLHASVKCLGVGGRFVEIGKLNIDADSLLSIELSEKEAEYHGVMWDMIMSDAGNVFQETWKLLHDGVNKGFIKPIPKTCFGRDELEKAFRCMTTRKHIGKVLITMREEERNKMALPKPIVTIAKTKLYCNPEGCYVIIGGLGGFGLELADFLAIRGAKKIVLVSRKGLSTGYQQLRLKIWSSYNCKIEICKEDASTIEGCKAIFNIAQEMGEIVGIFNLALVLHDAILENQTEELFLETYNPKGQTTIFLDQLSRNLAPKLEYFVVFSSVSCSLGNLGQTNYGYSNSVMERICENRVNNGLPGKAIQWGLIGDVGLVAESKERHVELAFNGARQQRISNCLEVLDRLILSDDTIVSSMVVAEKQSGKSGDNMIKVILEVMQIKDINTISPSSKFPELGMDSMMEVEIKRTLEREFDVIFSQQELRNMSFTKLNEFISAAGDRTEEPITTEGECDIPLVTLKTKTTDSSECSLYLLPGLEGMPAVFEPMAKLLSVNAKCFQFPHHRTEGTIKDMALQKVKILEKELQSNKPFTIVAHSLGATLALEVLTMLEDMDYKGTLLIVDGSPLFSQQIITSMMHATEGDKLQLFVIINIMSSVLSPDEIGKLKKVLPDAESFEERCTLAIELFSDKLCYSNEFLQNLLISTYERVSAELVHKFTPRTYKSRIVLCKASVSCLPHLPEDFGLGELLNNRLEIQQFQGDHISVLCDSGFIKFVESAVNNGYIDI